MPTLLEVMITTLGERALAINLPESVKEVAYLIVVQNADDNLITNVSNHYKERADVRLFFQKEKGLSKGRNLGLGKLEAKYALIADDDITYKKGFHNSMFRAFSDIPGADMITFKVDGIDKTYQDDAFKHNNKSIGKVSSIEIAFKTNAVKKNKLLFNTNFGLGAKFATGEEFLFLKSAIEKGLSLWYYPKVLVTHPKISSGRQFTEALMLAKGALFKAGFPYLFPMVNIWFSLKKYPQYKERFSLLKACKLLFSGSHQFKNAK